jgi:hypothetical protein
MRKYCVGFEENAEIVGMWFLKWHRRDASVTLGGTQEFYFRRSATRLPGREKDEDTASRMAREERGLHGRDDDGSTALMAVVDDVDITERRQA